MAYDMEKTAHIITQTREWIEKVVIGCNFCPFAARVVKDNSIHYQVEEATELAPCLQSFMQECTRLDSIPAIATTILIFPGAFQRFDDYLDLVDLAEKLLKKNGYDGIYQVASFHPLYRFAGTAADDAANYTNRSIYPMLHLLREDQITQALSHYPNPDQIPARNVGFARAKGAVYMQMLRESCLGSS